MEKLGRILSCFLIVSVLGSAAYGFDTGSHFDLTGTVMSERGFTEDAVKAVQVENWLTDYYTSSPTIAGSKRASFEKLHFDNLYSTSQVNNYWIWFVSNVKLEMQNAARRDDVLAGLTVLGIGLHAMQDLYTHSNWVETHPRTQPQVFRTDTFRPVTPVDNVLLFTGKYPADRTIGPDGNVVPQTASIHGDYSDPRGINHDSLIRPRWDESYVFAYAGSHELVEALSAWAEEVRPGFWKKVQTFTCLDKSDKSALDLDVSAARNMSMWITNKIRVQGRKWSWVKADEDGHWKGNRSGRLQLFRKFTARWVFGKTSRFVKAIKATSIADKMSEHLYSKDPPPAVASLPRFSLKRRAIVVSATLVRDIAGTHINLYSKIKIGGQEFWGRTLQDLRESVDPWREIYFADLNVKDVPIHLGVLNEDDTDSANDLTIDINAAPGKNAIDLIFNTSTSRLGGDLTGKFDSPLLTFSSSGEPGTNNQGSVVAYVAGYTLK